MAVDTKFKVGDYVRARPDFLAELDDDRHEPMAEHFGGKIISLDPAEGYALISLDADSLAHFTADDVRQMDEEGLDPYQYAFGLDQLVPAPRRDTEATYRAAVARIEQLLDEQLAETEEEYEATFQRHKQETLDAFATYLRQSGAEEDDFSQQVGSIELFMDMAFNYADVTTPEEYTPYAVEEVMLDVMPRKLSANRDYYVRLADTCVTYLDWLGQSGRLRDAPKVLRAARAAAKKLPARAMDPSRWGISKTLMMGMQDEGIDPTDRQQLDAYITRYNAGLDLPRHTATPPPSPPPHERFSYGRNDRITVEYEDGSRKENTKFKYVEKDLREGRCRVVG
ncbi:hypothetical protein [Neolewinella sp.]|uniref:hypothetical protein n=1 Tax=Neolewinella sp. TaxID=2993543 RepID=UPI003B52ECE0